MLRIAVYSDIHGNIPGLQAVHNEIDRQGPVDIEICLGDLVYGGPGTGGIIDMIEKRNAVFLRGNHDEDIINFRSVLPTLPKTHRKSAQIWNDWLLSKMTNDELKYLSESPLSLSMVLPDNREITFCHSLPDSTSTVFLGPDVSLETRANIFSRIKTDIICSGHWHEPVFWNRGSIQVLCPGSVGLTSNGIARWMLIEAENDFTNFQQKGVRYNVDEFNKLAAEEGMPDILHPSAEIKIL